MDEALPPGGRLGRQPVDRKGGHDLSCEAQGVDELAGRVARMDVDPSIPTIASIAENDSCSTKPRSEPSSV